MRFSVVIPTYNRRSAIGNAIRSSARQQGAHDLEFVIVDDSTDDTLEVAAQVAAEFPRCRLLTHKGTTRLGVGGARNRGIDLATGDVCVFLDSDDELEPGALDTIADFFAARPEIDILFGAVRMKSGRAPIREADFLDRVVEYQEFVSTERAGEFLPVVRRSVFTRSGERYPAELDGFEGVLWYRLARLGYRYYFTSKTLRLYDDLGTDRNCDTDVRLRRARKMARGHVHELREFGSDVRERSELVYQRKIAKAALYNRVAGEIDAACDDFLRVANPLVFYAVGLVPRPFARRLFGAAVRLFGR